MKLYLFTNELTLRVIREGKLPLFPVAELQDPFLDEAVPAYTTRQAPVSDHEFRNELQRQYRALSEDIRSIVSFDYFAKEASQKRAQIEAAMQDRRQIHPQYLDSSLAERIAVGSFFEHIQNPMLWRHRAMSHRGIALEFDVELAQFRAASYEDKPQFFSEVQYSDERPQQPYEASPAGDTQADRFRPLLWRPAKMSGEGEWRLVRPLAAAQKSSAAGDGQRCGFFRFPPAALTGVIFGCYTPATDMQHITKALGVDMRFRHVTLYALQKDPVRYLFHKVEQR